MTDYAKVKSLARWQDWEKGHSASESGSRRTLTLFVIKTSVSLGKAIGGRQASGWDFNSDFFYILCIRWIVNTFTMEIALQELHSNFSWAEELYFSLWVCLIVIGKGSPFLKCFVSIWAFFHLFFSLPKWAKMCTYHLGNIFASFSFCTVLIFCFQWNCLKSLRWWRKKFIWKRIYLISPQRKVFNGNFCGFMILIQVSWKFISWTVLNQCYVKHYKIVYISQLLF